MNDIPSRGLRATAALSVLVLASGCTQPAEQPIYSAFGDYVALPEWSTWCGASPDPNCAAALKEVVDLDSRPRARAHGWKMWAGSWSAIKQKGFVNDAIAQRTSMYGTDGCWAEFDASIACSGVYPIWLTWPNNGKPFEPDPAEPMVPVTIASEDQTEASSRGSGPLLNINREYDAWIAPQTDPDPTERQTVNPVPHPIYPLPPRVLTKGCGIAIEDAGQWLREKEYQTIEAACDSAQVPDLFHNGELRDGTAFVNEGNVMIATESVSPAGFNSILRHGLHVPDTLTAMYTREQKTLAPKIDKDYISTKHMFWPVKGCRPGVRLGEAGCRVRYGALPPWIPSEFASFSYATNADYLGYEKWSSVVAIDTCLGGSAECPVSTSATLELAAVFDTLTSGDTIPLPPIQTENPAVYPVGAFLHVQVSEQALSTQFTMTDRALLDQATIWAYGDQSNGFEAGDFLVVVAMHINTKELDSWTFQSVWWSPMTDALADCPSDEYNHCFGQTALYGAMSEADGSVPNVTSGLVPSDIELIDAAVGTTWRDYYLLTDSYGIGYELDGTPVTIDHYFAHSPPQWATTSPSGDPLPLLPVSQNVYIEPVIHPLGTNCRNCHQRAGYVPGNPETQIYPQGAGRASYQTAQCPSLLGNYGRPASNVCMTLPWAWFSEGVSHCREVDGLLCRDPFDAGGEGGDAPAREAFPVVETDYIWILADGHWWQPEAR